MRAVCCIGYVSQLFSFLTNFIVPPLQLLTHISRKVTFYFSAAQRPHIATQVKHGARQEDQPNKLQSDSLSSSTAFCYATSKEASRQLLVEWTIRWGAYKESSKSLQGIHYYFWRSVALAAECSENIILAKSDCCVDVNCWWWWWWRCFILNERERL